MKLTVATCQFPIDKDIRRNERYILDQMRRSKDQGAHVVHFSEVALSGYAGVEFPSMASLNWDRLRESTDRILGEARRLKTWVILGSTHRLSGRHRPHNSLYIVNARGEIVDRYDKMFCTGTDDRNGRTGDLKHYSPGTHLPVFSIRGARCGAQICHDFRYQELYREYKRRGVQLVFHSYHNGHSPPEKARKERRRVAGLGRLNGSDNIHGIIVPPTMQAYAANNCMWISANNTSARQSSWPSFFVRPDGAITGRLRRNVAGILISHIDTDQAFYDASGAWRNRAMKGMLHSGTPVKDRRSDDRHRH